jgi:hypothetical protein
MLFNQQKMSPSLAFNQREKIRNISTTKKKKFFKNKVTKFDILKGKTIPKKTNLKPIEEKNDNFSDKSSKSLDFYQDDISEENELSEFSRFIVNPFKGEKSKRFNDLGIEGNFEEYTGYDDEGSLPPDKLSQI